MTSIVLYCTACAIDQLHIVSDADVNHECHCIIACAMHSQDKNVALDFIFIVRDVALPHIMRGAAASTLRIIDKAYF